MWRLFGPKGIHAGVGTHEIVVSSEVEKGYVP